MSTERQATIAKNKDRNNLDPVLPKNNVVLPEVEIDGPSGLEPTRYGDWEKKGRCIDF